MEKTYQVLTQVSGRSGRHDEGKVIIQTYNPGLSVIQTVLNNDFKSFYKSQIKERELYKYPPFFKLLKITFLHSKKSVLDQISSDFNRGLKNNKNVQLLFSSNIPAIYFLGPEYPIIEKISNNYLKTILIKFDKSNKKTLKVLEFVKKSYLEYNLKEGIRIILDIDPI